MPAAQKLLEEEAGDVLARCLGVCSPSLKPCLGQPLLGEEGHLVHLGFLGEQEVIEVLHGEGAQAIGDDLVGLHAGLVLEFDHQQCLLAVQAGGGDEEEPGWAVSSLAVAQCVCQFPGDLDEVLLVAEEGADRVGQGGVEFRRFDDLASQAGEDVTQLALEFEAHVLFQAAERLAELERRKLVARGTPGHYVNDGLVHDEVPEVGPHCPTSRIPPAPRRPDSFSPDAVRAEPVRPVAYAWRVAGRASVPGLSVSRASTCLLIVTGRAGGPAGTAGMVAEVRRCGKGRWGVRTRDSPASRSRRRPGHRAPATGAWAFALSPRCGTPVAGPFSPRAWLAVLPA